MKVAIIGGGIGGMSLALSLVAAGLDDVDVYESAPAIRELGVGINVLPHAIRELTELGLLDQLAAVGIPTADFSYFSRLGQWIRANPSGPPLAISGHSSRSIAGNCSQSYIGRCSTGSVRTASTPGIISFALGKTEAAGRGESLSTARRMRHSTGLRRTSWWGVTEFTRSSGERSIRRKVRRTGTASRCGAG